ncbi:putative homoserine dehydrogenase-like protein [Homoserinimonas aerilata]|uniref:Putative homoserine dehydrogenase-like protein n=1 Tax=Homoserinimonas aerilata TaxID=1162970 RepID=A0A542YFV4_9MICO|nr:homoserine dehydrogenase [Homoserinimonas aerilata]TQL46966.1 putative homoserine dehydrogenase-like protein [Homoserinimonas aerilata]
MNIEALLKEADGAPIRIALTGANGAYARTLLAQLLLVPSLHPAILCDLDLEGLRATLSELGYPAERLVLAAEASDAPSDAIILSDDVTSIGELGFDILVEATGNPAIGYQAALSALESGHHVAMVSKEVDSIAGSHLLRVAARNDVVYTLAGGDQPANLLGLISWVRTLGLDIVAVGKSSEYDLVLDPDTGQLSQLDETIDGSGMLDHLDLGTSVTETLAKRAEVVEALNRRATADYCEMAVVATNGGFSADVERLHYPVARTAELADIYSLQEDGGILSAPGRIDVFSALRLRGEASFAGGVFVVVRTHDSATWRILAEKGHVVSRNERYAAIYLPYHFMGIETPLTLLAIARLGLATGYSQARGDTLLAGRAARDLPTGTVLSMGGHHHDVAGVNPVLVERGTVPVGTAPLYVLSFATTVRDIRAGELIAIDDVSGYDPVLLAASTTS